VSVADFHARRWDAIDDPARHSPLDALRAAVRAIESGDAESPDHIVVAFGRTTADGGSGHNYFQAGSYPCHATIGLIEAVKSRLLADDS
jgi:hypothetical protein